MSDYSSYGSGGDSDKKQQVMDQVRGDLALANAQELINKMNEKCFTKCVPKPGYRLESGEKTCLSKCMDRYMEAWNVVSRTYVNRLQEETRQHGNALGGGFIEKVVGGVRTNPWYILIRFLDETISNLCVCSLRA
ncbi:Tim10/DDP family zinc finger-domain-containing protein [Jimgerdemannia flammicorona]|uniref:Mitochondrial import inner membrane translocase subunit n=1 Tax=Jimgerdemannia flammicorona TaxID=994334 RepID=A0A433D2P7_9FUNG|nr:Tim10/DDP family zinc finger-domain-containing protein [Jimgerdemannia flammicorona]